MSEISLRFPIEVCQIRPIRNCGSKYLNVIPLFISYIRERYYDNGKKKSGFNRKASLK